MVSFSKTDKTDLPALKALWLTCFEEDERAAELFFERTLSFTHAYTATENGELIAAVSGNTILKDAVDLSVGELSKEYLIEGYKYASENSLGEALFKVRILKNLFNNTPAEVYSFFMGAILSDDVSAVLRSSSKRIFVSGTKYIRKPIALILREISDLDITEISETESEQATLRGQIKIIEEI